MAKSKAESILIDRSLTDIEVTNLSHPESSVRPELVVFTHEPTGIVIDLSLNFGSKPITGKKMRAMINRIRRRQKRQAVRTNKGPIIEFLFRKIQTDKKTKGE